MKKWFNNLSLKQQKIILITLSIISMIIVIVGVIVNFYILFIGIVFFIPLLILLNIVEKKTKKKQENITKHDIQDSYERKKYKELISNNFDLDSIKNNFQCSLLIMTLNQIKENNYFNHLDFNFNIDERINEIELLGKKFFNESKYNNFIALDLETTGLNPENDRIIQIALIKVANGIIVDKFTSLVNPQMHISSKASEINGIYDEDVKNNKTIQEIFPDIMNFIEKYPLVAHNAKFDISFLKNEYIRCFNKHMPYRKNICTMKLWKKLFFKFQNEDVISAKLNTLVINLLNKEEINEYQKNKHDAYCDAIATAKVFMKMYDNSVDE